MFGVMTLMALVGWVLAWVNARAEHVQRDRANTAAQKELAALNDCRKWQREARDLTMDVKVLERRVRANEAISERVNKFFEEEPVVFEEWGEEDARGFEKFLGTPTGKKFLAKLREVEVERNRAAVSKMRVEASAAAYGWSSCLTWIVSLSVCSEPYSENHSASPLKGAEELRESLTP